MINDAGPVSKNGFQLKKLLRKDESWISFTLKSVLVLFLLFLAGVSFASRFMIVGDPQEERCIPGYTVYLIDKNDVELERGKLYMFHSKDLSPIYKEGTNMLKYLRGMPGDLVEVRENNQVFINEKAGEYGLDLAEEKLGRAASTFHGKSVLGTNQYWFLGTSTRSFDSRYWGSVANESIVGRAYPLF